MPALWQSSQRPMYVRTVWVDGLRHAILTHDDPYFLKLNARKRRPHSSATCTTNKLTSRTARSSRSHTATTNSFNFVVRNDRAYTRPGSPLEPPIEKLNLTDVEQESEDDIIIRANTQPLNEFDISDCYRRNNHHTMKAVKSNRTARQEIKENTELSERVFQWLDLAGKVDLLAPENVERMAQPRHSWPEIQRRNNLTKSKTSVDVRKETGKITSPKMDSAKTPQSGTIDRHEFYEPTSANTIEAYARQSRHAKSTTRNDASKPRDIRTKHRDLKTNIHEARQKVVSEREAIEKQYVELLNKKLIPDFKTTKKQVHIFMPEVPKKGTSETTSRTESLLSQFSHFTHKSK